MKIIDAFWEKRNLGVSCSEITIENDDSANSLLQQLQLNNKTEYIVIKVPTNRIDISSVLTTQGFTFVECIINLKLDIKNCGLSKIEERICNTITYTEVSGEKLNTVYEEINKGLFSTDRVAVDPFFTPSQASNRYVNWIKDEVSKGANVYEIILKDKAIGFFTFKTIGDNNYFPFLAGLYQDYQKSGLGFVVIRKSIEEVIKRGGGIFNSFVSTNNPSILNIHLKQGFIIKQMSYIYVKHQ